MFLYEKKDISNKAQSIRNKPLKNSNLPGIQLEKLLNKSTFIQSKKKDITESETNLALSITSNSSRYKCDELGIRSPTLLNDSSHLLFSQKSSHFNPNNVSRTDVLSKLHDAKPNIIKIVEELAEVKHQNVKQQNMINIISQKMKSLRNIIKLKNQEIELLNKNHKEIMDKFVSDSQNYQKLNAEYYLLQESFKKIHKTFKSTINIMVDIIDIALISPYNLNNKLKISNNSVFENTIDAISFLTNEDSKNKAIIDIKNILISNLSYIHKNLKIDLDEEVQKIKKWEVYPPTKSIISLDFCRKHLDIVSEDCNFSIENLFSSLVYSSPKFSNEKDSISSLHNSFKFMTNFNGSLKDLEIKGPSIDLEKEEEKKTAVKPNNYFPKINLEFNNNPTEFNIEIINDFINEKDLNSMNENTK